MKVPGRNGLYPVLQWQSEGEESPLRPHAQGVPRLPPRPVLERRDAHDREPAGHRELRFELHGMSCDRLLPVPGRHDRRMAHGRRRRRLRRVRLRSRRHARRDQRRVRELPRTGIRPRHVGRGPGQRRTSEALHREPVAARPVARGDDLRALPRPRHRELVGVAERGAPQRGRGDGAGRDQPPGLARVVHEREGARRGATSGTTTSTARATTRSTRT